MPLLDSIGSVKAYGWGSFSIPPAFESIATATGTGSSNTITFSSIPGTYQHLQLRIISKAVGGSLLRTDLRFNSDTASNYTTHSLGGNGASVNAYSEAPRNRITYGLAYETSIGDNTNANVFGVAILDIHDYASTSKFKTVRCISGLDTNNTSLTGSIVLDSGLWRSTSAITSMTIQNSGELNWKSGSIFALYGIKAGA